MKKLISMLLAVVMICSVMTVPAFATSDFVYGSSSSYGMEYGESGGMVGVIRKTDEFGKTIYVHSRYEKTDITETGTKVVSLPVKLADIVYLDTIHFKDEINGTVYI